MSASGFWSLGSKPRRPLLSTPAQTVLAALRLASRPCNDDWLRQASAWNGCGTPLLWRPIGVPSFFFKVSRAVTCTRNRSAIASWESA
ncbi:hypothetical protein D3C76_1484580 [compost metagenome]